MRSLHLALIGTAMVTAAVSADAQRQPVGPYAEGGAVFVALDGRDFAGIDDGVGFDALAGYAFGPFMLGGGIQRSSHDVDDVSDNVTIDIAFIEPRYDFDLGAGTVTPFLFGRFGRVQEKLDSPTRSFEADGYLFGAGAGMRLQVAPSLSFTLSGLYSRLSIDDVATGGTASPESDVGGSGIIARAGISFRFGQGTQRKR
jgi:opacity protein-like surface antigen